MTACLKFKLTAPTIPGMCVVDMADCELGVAVSKGDEEAARQ